MAGDDLAPVTIAVVDDHPVIHDGVRAWLAASPARVELIQAAGTVEEILTGPGARADVLVLDLDLGETNALGRIPELCADGHRVVVFSFDSDEGDVLTALTAGASAFLNKAEGSAHFVETVLAAAADRSYVSPSTAGAMLADARTDRPRLSDQERNALRWWFQGMSKQSVATRMGLSVHTVNQYISRARLKYGRAGRPGPTKAALLARAIEDGLIRADEVNEYRSLAAAGLDFFHPDPLGRPVSPSGGRRSRFR